MGGAPFPDGSFLLGGKQGVMTDEKINLGIFPGVAIISRGLIRLFQKSPPGETIEAPGNETQRNEKMSRNWKIFFSLDFEDRFAVSFLKLFLFWNPILTLLVSFLLGNRTVSSILFRWGWSFFEASLVGLFGMAMTKVFLTVEKFWALHAQRNIPRHGTGWFLLLLAFVAPAGLYLDFHIKLALINWYYAGDPIPVEFHWQYYGTEVFWVWTLLLLCFLFMSWQDLKDAARSSKLRTEELEKERLQALLTKLKDQMNPHFLFNTLNTVASLIHDDPAKAEKVVVRLSALYQGVLASSEKSYHPLAKELGFCKDYLEIEQVRFGSRLKAKIKPARGLDAGKIFVPVLLLQPLVENAVKHGLSSRASGGNLTVGAELKKENLELWVEDDGVGFGNSNYSGSGTALENCRKRLDLSFGKEGRLEIARREGGGTRVLMTLPLLTTDPSVKEEK